MATVHKLSAEWKGTGEPPAQNKFHSVSLVGEMYGPRIANNAQRRQVQYNAQVLESIRVAKLNRYDADYTVKSQPFYRP